MKNNRNGYEPNIPGVSDVDIMPRRGFIRLGESMEERAERGLNYPKELNHLGRIDASEEDMKLYHSIYGSEPDAIKIVFASNQATVNFPQEFVSWNSRGQKKCYGNGQMGFKTDILLSEEAAKKLEDAKDDKERKYLESRMTSDDYDYKETLISCPGFDCPTYKDNKCQLEGTLKFLIVGMKGLRLFWIRTGSKWTMKTIRTMHENIRSLTSPNGDPDFGRIRGIPLLLTREKKQYSLPTGIKTTRWVLSLDVADVGISDLLALAEPVAMAERAKGAKKLLQGPEEVVGETGENENFEKEAGPEMEAEEEIGEKPKVEDFHPETKKEDFESLDKDAKIEVIEQVMKAKDYDKSSLKKPLDEFTNKQMMMFWESLQKMEDAKQESSEEEVASLDGAQDDIPW